LSATFDLYALRFRFTACEALHFPPGKSGNILRGSFGRIFKKLTCAPDCADARQCSHRAACAYARLFEPASAAGEGPSGLQDWPRPFVFRSSHLDGVTIASGASFHFGLNVFEMREPAIEHFTRAFTELAREGLGPGRRPAVLETVEGREPLRLSLQATEERVERVRVRFLTPTELKGAQRPEFAVLLARIRDRISTLRALYGAGPLEVDFKAMGERAARVAMTRCEIDNVEVERLSGRTGQRHSLGGFVGVAEYRGDLSEFAPYLEIARLTGVGRHTVWGKGEIACETL
jgi:hypothetical protein